MHPLFSLNFKQKKTISEAAKMLDRLMHEEDNLEKYVGLSYCGHDQEVHDVEELIKDLKDFENL